MPKNKNAYLRYLVIHNQLKRNQYKPGYPSKEDLLRELEDQGLGVTGSQLEKDFRFLRDEKGAPLIYDAGQKCYRYSEDWEFDIALGPDEVRILRMAMHKLELFSEAPEFNMVKDSIERLGNFFNLPDMGDADTTNKYILFEYTKGFTGNRWLPLIYDAIFQNREIVFTHCKYSCDRPTTRTIQPYSLKEHRNRWYVIGKEGDEPRIFGIDRITDLKVTDIPFEQEASFYDVIFNVFRDAVGVLAFNFESQDVVLHFDAEQADYVRTPWLHRSQVITEDGDGSGGITVRMKVKVTPEFIRECILPFGSSVKVVSPAELAGEVKKIYRKALENY